MAKQEFDKIEVKGAKVVTTIPSSMLDYIAIQGLDEKTAEQLKADYLSAGHCTHGVASWGESK